MRNYFFQKKKEKEKRKKRMRLTSVFSRSSRKSMPIFSAMTITLLYNMRIKLGKNI